MRRSVFPALLGCFAFTACGGAPAVSDASNGEKETQLQTAVSEAGTVFTIVMLGDSITAGFGLPAGEALPVKVQAALRADGVYADVINAGLSGDTTGDARARLEWALSDDTDAIVIALGGNDLLQGVDPATTETNLRAIIEAAKARGLKVALAGMRAPGNYGENYRTAFDAIYPRLAREYGAPLYPYLLAGVAADPALNQRDGIHPNEAGVEIIVAGLTPFLETSVISK